MGVPSVGSPRRPCPEMAIAVHAAESIPNLRRSVPVSQRLLFADDHEIVLEGLQTVAQKAGHEVVGTAHNGAELVESALRLCPDVIVSDISMPILNGFEAAKQIHAQAPLTKVIFMSVHSSPAYVREALHTGASGYLMKGSASDELPRAIAHVTSQTSPYLSSGIDPDIVHGHTGLRPSVFLAGELTERQRQVLQLVAAGKTAKEISQQLGISPKTVEFHKSGIMSALGVRTVAGLTRYAIEQEMSGN